MNGLLNILKTLHLLGGGDDMPPNGVISASFIGIVVAISGNVLISLALNCQKLAHRRIEEQKTMIKGRRRNTSIARRGSMLSRVLIPENLEEGERSGEESDEQTRVHSPSEDGVDVSRGNNALLLQLETDPLLLDPWAADGAARSPQLSVIDYGSRHEPNTPRRGFLQNFFSSQNQGSKPPRINGDDAHVVAIPVEFPPNVGPPNAIRHNTRMKSFDDGRHQFNDGSSTEYLKSKLWWLGFSLMNVGELGNFISYAFAPASIVAPLGTFALVANCFFAPLMLKERFRRRDLLGVALSILGAVTVVLSANPSDTRLTPDGLFKAIQQPQFIAFTSIYVVGAVTLVGLSSRRFGSEHVFVDVGACALFGGFTVLSTKAFSSMLTLEWWGIVTEWITFPILFVLVGTGVGQIMFLNRALMKFDSKIVIPTQFVLFTLSAIVGSAVLYGDFRSMTLHQLVTFGYGCGATFAGVFILTWASSVETSDATDPEGQHREGSADRGRTQFALPATPLHRETAIPILRTRASTLSLVGFSPAQRVLLVRTPPTNEQMPRPRIRAESASGSF